MLCDQCSKGLEQLQGNEESQENALKELLLHSRERDCREQQGTDGIIEVLQEIIQRPIDQRQQTIFLTTLRLLRNLCGGCLDNQNKILTNHFVSQLKIITERLWKGDQSKVVTDNLLAMLQLLGNGVAGNAATQEIVWQEFFPHTLLALLGRPNHRIFSMACFIINNITANNDERLATLSSPEGCLLLSELIARITLALQDRPDEEEEEETCTVQHIEWARFILHRIIERGQFPGAYLALSSLNATHDSTNTNPTKLQLAIAWLLEHEITTAGLICLEMVEKDEEDTERSGLVLPLETAMFFIMEIAGMLSDNTKKYWDEAEDCRRPLIDVWLPLLNTLLIIPSVPTDGKIRETAVQYLASAAVGQLRLGWEAIPIVKPRAQSKSGVEMTDFGALKTELIRVVGNMCYHTKEAQDRVRMDGGIPLVLNHCQLDSHNPYIREWAVLAIRNLCEDNSENQQAIQQLEKQGVEHDPELGVELKVDDATGKISVLPNKKA